MRRIEIECQNQNILRFGWQPISSIWKDQTLDTELRYLLKEDTILGFFVGARHDATAVYTLKKEFTPKNFLHLVGYVRGKDNIFFGEATDD